jgi:hypothetical protein
MTITGKKGGLAALGLAALASALAGCGGGHACLAGTPALRVTWSIEQNNTQAPLSCAQAGADHVDITVGSMVASFPCDDHSAVTDLVAPGRYGVSLDLINVNGNTISTFGPVSVDFVSCDFSDLPNIIFPIGTP